MRWFNFEINGTRRLGVSWHDRLLDATVLTDPRLHRVLDYLFLTTEERKKIDAEVERHGDCIPPLDPSRIRFLSIAEPETKFMCIGQNYADHCREQNVAPPTAPILFCKMNNALAGHGEIIPVPATTTSIDFEVELAVVIGRPCHRVSRAEALQYVAGYTVVNDISARDHQRNDGQWVRAKSLDKFGPNGPFLVTPEEVPNPHNLNIWLDLNGRRMQQSNTCNLIFDIPYLIEYYSRDITLLPGDLISTGTPPGVGCFRNPPVFVKPGDKMEATVETVGTLVNWLGRAN